MTVSWKFERRQAACASCGAGFQADQEVFSLLRFESVTLCRGDLCSECFEGDKAAGDLVWWRSRHAGSGKSPKLDIEAVLGLLEALSGDARAERKDLAFLLALLGVRHRKLRLIGVGRTGGREFLRLKKVRSRTEFPVEVRDPDVEARAALTTALAGFMDAEKGEDWEALLANAEAPEEKVD